jgi:uncharacterized protein YukE
MESNQMEADIQSLRDENESLKNRIAELEQEQTKSQDEEGEIFLEYLANMVNQGYFNKINVQDSLYAVAKVDWDKMIEEDGTLVPSIYYIADHPSSQVDWRKIYNIETMIGRPVSKEGRLSQVIHQAMKSPRPSMETDFLREDVVDRKHGYQFKSSVMAIRNRKGKVIGGFGIGIHLGVYNEIHGLFEEIATLIEEIVESKDQVIQTDYEKPIKEMANLTSMLEDLGKSVRQSLDQISSVQDQLRVLSMNASIESARAGIHGRGFAVVASEVRKLADKSKDSIESITNLVVNTFEYIHRIVELREKLTLILQKRTAVSQNQIELITRVEKYLNDISRLNRELQEQDILARD